MAHRDRVFRVFISSTFSDFVAERNALQERVFPQLRERCRERGFRFQAIDLRWGVSDEAGLDQRTMDICLRELRLCQEASPRPNFVVLLGDRYGWVPLPSRVDAAEFEETVSHVAGEHRALLSTWYRRDDNAVPAEYVLQPRRGDEPWPQIEARLRALLLAGASAHLPEGDRRLGKYASSATHQEIIEGFLEAAGAEEHVFFYQRQITDLPQAPAARGYTDHLPDGSPDYDARSRLADLRLLLASRVPPEHGYQWKVSWEHRGDAGAIDLLCRRMEQDLWRVMESEISTIGVRSDLDREIRAHQDFGAERIRHFTGRGEIRGKVRAYLERGAVHPVVLHGPSGSGKTSLMAQLAVDAEAGRAAVVRRFIGATPGSLELRSLLEGIWAEVTGTFDLSARRDRELQSVEGSNENQRRQDRERILGTYEFPADLHNASTWLRAFLALVPPETGLVVFLDALDQLGSSDSARTLHWLPRELPPHVRLIVSTTEEEGPAGECLRAAQRALPAESFEAIGQFTDADAKALLHAWMTEVHRTLTPPQHAEVMRGFEGCPLPLYLKLAFEAARRWRSYDATQALGADVPGLIRDLCLRLESAAEHGVALVSNALGYLAAARYGLTEDELLDVLSADDEFFRDFLAHAHHAVPQQRVPVVVLSRLLSDLASLLNERRSDDTPVLGFYHRQVGEVVAGRYLPEGSRTQFHRKLAAYFGGETPVAAQPDVFVAADGVRHPNLRKLSEYAYHLNRAGLWDELARTLLRPSFLEAKVEAGRVFDLAADLRDALARIPADHDRRRLLALFQAALRRDLHFVARHPVSLFQCLWNRGWWHDCPQAESHTTEPRSGWPAPGPPWKRPEPRLSTWLESWRAERDASSPRPWLRCLRPLPGHLESDLIASIDAHQEAGVGAVAFLPDGVRALSVGHLTHRAHSLRIWDLARGEEVLRLHGPTTYIRCLAVSPDGRHIAGGSWKGQVHVWDSVTGKELVCVTGEKKFNVVAFSADGRRIAAGGESSQVWVWDVSGRPLARLDGLERELTALAFTRSGEVVAGDDRGTLYRWHVDSARLVAADHGRVHGRRRVRALSPDGRYLIFDGEDGVDHLQDLASPATCIPLNSAHLFPSYAFSADGTAIARGETSSPQVFRWSSGAGRPLAGVQASGTGVLCVALSPDGRRLLTGDSDGTLCLWEPGTGVVTGEMPRHERGVSAVAISADGARVVTASESGEICNWDANSGLQVDQLKCHGGNVKSLDFSADGRFALSIAIDQTFRIWDIGLGMQRACLGADDDIAADDWLLLRALGGTVTIPPGGNVSGGAFSPDARCVACAMGDGHVMFWDIEKGNMWKKFLAHAPGLACLAFSPDGRRLAVGFSSDSASRPQDFGDERLVRVWDLATEQEVARFGDPSSSAEALAFSPDGSALAIETASGVEVWNLAATDRPVARYADAKDVSTIALGAGAAPWSISAHRGNESEILAMPHRRAIAWLPQTLGPVAMFPDGRSWAGGNGRDVVMVRLEGETSGKKSSCTASVAIVTAVRVYEHDARTWQDALTARCPHCGERFAVPRQTLEATGDGAICFERPASEWNDPRLHSLCPHCSGAFRFNPFRVDPRPWTDPEYERRVGQREEARVLQEYAREIGLDGAIAMKCGDAAKARARFEEQLSICREPPSTVDRVDACLLFQSKVYENCGDFAAAADCVRQRLPILDQLNALGTKAHTLTRLATLLAKVGDIRGALACEVSAEPLYRQTLHLMENAESLALCLGNQAIALREIGDLQGALQRHQEEERLCRDGGLDLSLARSLGNQSAVLFKLKRMDQSLALSREQELILRKLNARKELVMCLHNYALALAKATGRPDEAVAKATEAYEIAVAENLPHDAEQARHIISLITRLAGPVPSGLIQKRSDPASPPPAQPAEPIAKSADVPRVQPIAVPMKFVLAVLSVVLALLGLGIWIIGRGGWVCIVLGAAVVLLAAAAGVSCVLNLTGVISQARCPTCRKQGTLWRKRVLMCSKCGLIECREG